MDTRRPAIEYNLSYLPKETLSGPAPEPWGLLPEEVRDCLLPLSLLLRNAGFDVFGGRTCDTDIASTGSPCCSFTQPC